MSAAIWQVQLVDEAATVALAKQLAACAKAPILVTLKGPLAAGKTTFVRGFLRALGHAGKVKSPTFTLVETYELDGFTVHHFDLYRVVDPGELYYIGFDEYVDAGAICMIEWPERGAGVVPIPDLEIALISVSANARDVTITARTPGGISLLAMIRDP